MPFARHAGRVAFWFEELSERHLAVGDATRIARSERVVNTDPIGRAAREQRGARGGTDGLRDVEIRELPTFRRHAIEVRRVESFRAENADIRVALIVGENDDDVW